MFPECRVHPRAHSRSRRSSGAGSSGRGLSHELDQTVGAGQVDSRGLTCCATPADHAGEAVGFRRMATEIR